MRTCGESKSLYADVSELIEKKFVVGVSQAGKPVTLFKRNFSCFCDLDTRGGYVKIAPASFLKNLFRSSCLCFCVRVPWQRPGRSNRRWL
jgi:hypothetical protein